MSQWITQSHTLTLSSNSLPEITGQLYGKEFTEPLLHVRRLYGHEAVGELYEYIIEAEVRNPDFLMTPADAAQVDLEKIIGKWATVTIQIPGIGTYHPDAPGNTGRANIGADKRHISGDIVEAKIRCMEDRVAVYEFVLRPSVWYATQNRNSFIFKDASVIDVLKKILGDYHSFPDWRISGPWSGRWNYPPRDMIRQAWESDWQFVSRLLEEFGLFYWFEHRDQGFHDMVIADTMGAFHPHGVAYETLRYHTGSRIDEEHISELEIAYTLTPGRVVVNDHDYMNPRLAPNILPNREVIEKAAPTASQNIEIYEPADFAQPDRSNVDDLREEGQHLANVKLQAETCRGMRAVGKGNLKGLQPGRSFTLTGYPQKKANREYVVLRADLDITEIGTSSGSERLYSAETKFELQPSNVYFRLPQITPKPRIDACEYAVIVAPNNEEIWIDDKNRVKIQFDWDRQANYDGATSIWVRVMTQWQGGNMGMVTPARAGQMVLVTHVHGDPDRPVVAGFVVDKWNPPPWALPGNHALSGIRTQSLGHGELASNHLALDDTQGKMQAQLASDHAQSRLVLGYNTRIAGNKGRQEARGEGFELATSAHGVTRANKGLLITTDPRDGADRPMKDMDESMQRLAQADQQHDTLSNLAQRHEAQDMQHSQRGVIDAIRAQNDAISGKKSAATEAFPELARPDLVMSSAAGIATTAEDGTHQASRKDHAITAGRDVSVSSGRSFIAAVRGAISWFAHQWGIKLIAGHGKVEIQAHDDAIELAALKDVSIKSVNGEVVIAAEKGIGLYVGGSYVRITPSGIENGTAGTIVERCAAWAVQGAHTQTVPLPELPTGEMTSEWVTFVNHATGRPIAHFPYRLDAGGGRVVEGITDTKGRTAQVMAPTSRPVEISTPAAQDSTDTYHVRFLDELGNPL